MNSACVCACAHDEWRRGDERGACGEGEKGAARAALALLLLLVLDDGLHDLVGQLDEVLLLLALDPLALDRGDDGRLVLLGARGLDAEAAVHVEVLAAVRTRERARPDEARDDGVRVGALADAREAV